MKDFTIKPINEFTYTLKIQGDNVFPLYQSIKKQLKSIHYDSESFSLFFSAENIILLKEQTNQIMPYNKCIKLLDDLTKQIVYLKRLGYGFYGFDINDIVIIDNTFIICSAQYLLPIIEKCIIFYSPIKCPYFSSPEILELTTLPCKINYKCSYYSLGVLIIYCLLNKYLLVGNEIKSVKDIDNIIQPLNNTKIYWFIKRCLNKNIDNRLLLLI